MDPMLNRMVPIKQGFVSSGLRLMQNSIQLRSAIPPQEEEVNCRVLWPLGFVLFSARLLGMLAVVSAALLKCSSPHGRDSLPFFIHLL